MTRDGGGSGGGVPAQRGWTRRKRLPLGSQKQHCGGNGSAITASAESSPGLAVLAADVLDPDPGLAAPDHAVDVAIRKLEA